MRHHGCSFIYFTILTQYECMRPYFLLFGDRLKKKRFYPKEGLLIDFFFHPKGVAVVGATPEESTGGYYLLANLTLGYPGPIYPVNPKYDEILGLKCYPRVSEIEGPLDLALILVPARAVPDI